MPRKLKSFTPVAKYFSQSHLSLPLKWLPRQYHSVTVADLAPLPRAAPRFALDFGMEALIAQGLALVQRQPDLAESLVIESW
ncbi:MAG: hypothetical protein USCGTAYLOR_01011 [Chromatiales bacterium USCg_Taylor]|nr:MAG: hypothetical protein USCGTAYLOR_01011 [Chromatiales bacterium USCg_Taylor]